MGIRNILIEGEPTLRIKSRLVTDFGVKTANLLDDLKETMVQANGAGLAAPQVGILRRAVVIVNGEDIVELINPEIIESSEETEGEYEGCLSCPNKRALISRPSKVKVHAFDREGNEFKAEYEGLAARAACHELDHLEGTLFVDLADRIYTEDELDELLAETEEEE